jgi:phenylpyruvate tautomerase PptA (4-oxalocrotonate tautomerase family)
MPLLHVYVPHGLLDSRTKSELAERLTTTLLEVERIPNSPAARAMSWIFWHEMPNGTWCVSSSDPAQARCLVEVVAPLGFLDAKQKQAAISRLTADVASHWGAPDTIESRLRIWIIIREVPEGSWGVAGHVAPSAVMMSGLGGK